MKKLNRLMTAALLMTCSVSMVSYGAPRGGTAVYLKQIVNESSAAAKSTSAAGSAGELRTATKADQKVLADAGRKTSNLTSVEVQTAVDLGLKVGTESVNVLMIVKAKGQDMGKSSMKYRTDTHTEIMGQSTDMTAFYTNGYYYVDSDGEKTKLEAEVSDVMEVFDSNTNAGWLDNLDSFKDLKVRTEKSGSRVYSFSCDPSSAGSLIQSYNDQLGLSDSNMDMKLLYGTVYVDSSGYITRESLDLKMDFESDGQTVGTDMQIEIRYTNPGKAVTVTLPSTAGYY